MSFSWYDPPQKRIYGIDAFRFLSAFFVVANHGEHFEPFPVEVHAAVSILSKWSVPFFFIVIGYFLGKGGAGKNRSISPLIRISVMFVLASALLIPLDLLNGRGGYDIINRLSSTFLLSGGYYHLWFLSSLVIGLLAVRITDEYEVRWLLPACALACYILAVWLGTYLGPRTHELGRHLSSVPYIYLGLLLSKHSLPLKLSIFLLIAGLGIEVMEAAILGNHGVPVWMTPTMLGTLPFAIGIFGIASHLPNTKFIESMGRLGSRYTGCIYVFHLYFILLLDRIAGSLGILDSVSYCIAVVPAVVLLNLAVLKVIDRYAPICIDIMLGGKKAIQRAGNALAELPGTLVAPIAGTKPRGESDSA